MSVAPASTTAASNYIAKEPKFGIESFTEAINGFETYGPRAAHTTVGNNAGLAAKLIEAAGNFSNGMVSFSHAVPGQHALLAELSTDALLNTYHVGRLSMIEGMTVDGPIDEVTYDFDDMTAQFNKSISDAKIAIEQLKKVA
jgi:hypothetical protein